jgi:spore germination protein KB
MNNRLLEKGKISAFQMGVMMYATILATEILFVPAVTSKYAHQDMWLSPIWASVTGLLTVFVTVALNRLYPESNVFQYSERILGKVLGKVLGLLFLLFYLHVSGIVVRQYGSFIISVFLTRTPLFVLLGSMVLVCSFAVRGGVEVMGRAAQIFVPFLFVLVLSINLLLIPDLDPKNLFPMMEKGLKPSLLGSIPPQGWLSEYFLMAFLLPYVSDRKNGMKWGLASLVTVVVTLVMTNLTTLLLFGKLTENYIFPVLESARYISVAGFIEHVESILAAVWIMGMFVKVTVFYYAVVIGLSQWLNLSDYRPVVLPVGFLIVVMSIWVAPNLQELFEVIGTTYPFYKITVQTLIPTVLLLIALLRKNFPQAVEEEG